MRGSMTRTQTDRFGEDGFRVSQLAGLLQAKAEQQAGRMIAGATRQVTCESRCGSRKLAVFVERLGLRAFRLLRAEPRAKEEARGE